MEDGEGGFTCFTSGWNVGEDVFDSPWTSLGMEMEDGEGGLIGLTSGWNVGEEVFEDFCSGWKGFGVDGCVLACCTFSSKLTGRLDSKSDRIPPFTTLVSFL